MDSITFLLPLTSFSGSLLGAYYVSGTGTTVNKIDQLCYGMIYVLMRGETINEDEFKILINATKSNQLARYGGTLL
jgi:hypothetical protein